jgi:hypothetical protein
MIARAPVCRHRTRVTMLPLVALVSARDRTLCRPILCMTASAWPTIDGGQCDDGHTNRT